MKHDDLTGTTFAGLSVGRVIGRSAGGITYLAQKGESSVALRILPPRLAEAKNEAAVQFLKELDAATGLTHDNLVKVLGKGEEQGLSYAVLEYIEAPTLSDRLAEKRPLPLEEGATVLRLLLQACAAAHEAGLVHADLKPQSIFLLPGGTVKVAGFGVSKKRLHEAGLSLPGFDVEAVHYIAPEQVAASEVDARTDLYSVGVIGFEILVGQPPFTHDSLIALRMLHSIEPPPDPRKRNPSIPPTVSAFLLKLLSKEPNQRFPSAAAALKTFDIALAAATPARPVPAPPAQQADSGGGILAGALLSDDDEPGAESPLASAFTDAETNLEFGDQPTTPFKAVKADAGKVSKVSRILAHGLVAEAETRLEQYDFEAAAVRLEEAVELNPEDPEIRSLLVSTQETLSNYREKIASLERLREEGDLIEVEKIAREILEIRPEDPLAQGYLVGIDGLKKPPAPKEEVDKHVLKVHRLVQNKDWDRASQRVQAAFVMDPSRPDIISLKTQIEEKRQRIASLKGSAEEACSRGDYKLALADYKELREILMDPKEVDARIKEIQSAFVDVDGLMYNASQAWDRRNIPETEGILDRVLEHDPKNRKALFLKKEIEAFHQDVASARERGRANMENRQYKLAYDAFTEILGYLPDDAEASEKRAELVRLMQQRRPGPLRWVAVAAAVALLAAAGILGGFFFKNRSALDRAESLVGEKKYDEALAALDALGGFLVDGSRREALRARIGKERREAADTPASRADAALQRAREAVERADWTAAETAIAESISLEAGEDKVRYLQNLLGGRRLLAEGRGHEDGGDWTAALAAYGKAVALLPEEGQAAVDALFRSLLVAAEVLADTDPEAYVDRLEELGVAFDRADEVRALIAKLPTDPRLDAAGAALDRGDWVQAVQILREARQNPTVAAEAEKRLAGIEQQTLAQGDALLRDAKYESASALFADLFACFPDLEYEKRRNLAKYNGLMVRGEGKVRAGELDAAVALFKEAAAIGIDTRAEDALRHAEIVILETRAKTFEADGKLEEARAAYQDIQTLDPDNAVAAGEVARIGALLAYRGHVARMEEMFAQRDFVEALVSANDALKTGADEDGTAARAVVYLGPLLEMVKIPKGDFTMGDDGGRPREKPSRKVVLDEFFIARNEVTVAEYAAFLETPAGSGHEPANWEAQKKNGTWPVVGITLDDAKAYAAAYYFDVPTEEQWEKAARGSDARPFPWGADFGTNIANTYEAKRDGPVPVAEFAKDSSPFGCKNMGGNVAEWTASTYAPYPGGSASLPEGRIAVRGGDFEFGAKYARCTSRRGVAPGAKKDFLGFRVVRVIRIRSLRDLK